MATDHTAQTPQARLRELATEWRAMAAKHAEKVWWDHLDQCIYNTEAQTLRICADELEAILRQSEAPPTQEYARGVNDAAELIDDGLRLPAGALTRGTMSDALRRLANIAPKWTSAAPPTQEEQK